MFYSIFIQALVTVVVVVILQSIWVYLRSPLRPIPGPFIAKFTNLWRFCDVLGGQTGLSHLMLHEKYGSVVRLGPNLVSLSDPDLLRKIFDSRGDFKKSDLYSVNDTKVGNTIISNVFSTRSNSEHTRFRGPIQGLYKMSNLMKSEPLINDTITTFFRRLDEEFINGRTCKMDEWLLFFAWDVINQLTFDRPMGFMDTGADHTGFLDTANRTMDYFSAISQMPILDKWLAKNPIMKIGSPSFDGAAAFCAEQYMARQRSEVKSEKTKDMLDDLLEIKEARPEQLDAVGIIGALLVNVLAGADTTGILLRAIIYYVLKNPKVYRKLQQELDAANLTCPVSYAASSKLPYLDAVIKESSRMHPSVGHLLERIVPEPGLLLPNGQFLPPRTMVGMNAWVIQRNKNVFGQDANSFNPDRWFRDVEEESEESYAIRLMKMKRAELTFGAGKRICLGKDIAILETYKVVASLFRTYDIVLVDPEKEWKIEGLSWFVRQSGIDVQIHSRTKVLS